MAALNKALLLPVVFLGAACVAFFHFLAVPAGQSAFVAGPHVRGTAVSPVVQVLPAAAVALAPDMAEAATEQELNRFGFVFAIIFLLFFFAAFGRLLTVGKL
mmetsp:Transcript_71817/g.214418  ORF Transcript_71817/g.214418 Transcript_71817/m.214418 type:complete len:102 (-) Transcript_71817:56-361(-)